MTDLALKRLAWSLCALTLLVMASSLLLILLGWSTPLPQGSTPWRDRAISLVGIIGAPILGGLIASRRPRNAYGWVWLGFGLGLALQQLGYLYAAYARVVEPGPLLSSLSIAQVVQGGPVALGLAPFLLLLFPTGRLPSRRWRPLARLAVFSGTFTWVLNFIYGRPDQAGGTVTVMVSATVFVTFLTFVLAAFSLLARYRGASGIERQQLKWFALAAVLAVIYLIGEQVGLSLLLGETLWNLLNVATNGALYAAVGVAILRYRLYDIDLIINRALVYGLLTAMLVVVYFGAVTAAQSVFRTFTGQEQQPQLVVVASTLAIAALFNPLRRRIQAVVDRRFYRSKYDAAQTLELFSARLREETDLDSLNAEVLSVVRETMQPEHVSLWLRSTHTKDVN